MSKIADSMTTDLYRPQSYHDLNPFREGTTQIIQESSLTGLGDFEYQICKLTGERRILSIGRDIRNRQFLVSFFEDKEQADRWENEVGYLYRI